MKLTLGQAAKTAKRSKGTISKALNSGGISAIKDEKGRWQIDPSELSRWMDANPPVNGSESVSIGVQETPGNTALEVEVRMLREQLEQLSTERAREREQLVDQIEDLRTRLNGAEAERVRLNAVLTDQREKPEARPNSSWISRIMGKP